MLFKVLLDGLSLRAKIARYLCLQLDDGLLGDLVVFRKLVNLGD